LAVTRRGERLEGWQSGQDQLALYLYNGNEYLEGMLGAYKARVAPFNVNYRYVTMSWSICSTMPAPGR
jgi:3-oxocholest-4-en-26-oate---CoA ligase